MEQTEIYKGFTIEINNTDSPENPFTAWDGNAPLMYKSGYGSEDYSNGEIINYISSFFTDNQIIRHQKAIAEIFVVDLDFYKEFEYDKEQKIDDLRSAIENYDSFRQLEEFCQLAKIPHLKTAKNGYSQGDWAHIFICETPEYLEETGCKTLTAESMEGAADLWAYWAYNDVYSYYIDEVDDACGGFYGTDHEESGLMSYAKDAIDSYIVTERKKRFKRLKQLIKAKVSFIYRPQILEFI